jgi:hypothetical protein
VLYDSIFSVGVEARNESASFGGRGRRNPTHLKPGIMNYYIEAE